MNDFNEDRIRDRELYDYLDSFTDEPELEYRDIDELKIYDLIECEGMSAEINKAGKSYNFDIVMDPDDPCSKVYSAEDLNMEQLHNLAQLFQGFLNDYKRIVKAEEEEGIETWAA